LVVVSVSAPSIAAGVLSRPLEAAGVDLLASVPSPTGALAFVHDGEGLVGWGEYATLRVVGPDAAARIGDWYAAAIAQMSIVDQAETRGSGPVCFVSLGFGDDDPSVAVIPRVVLGRHEGRTFLTTIGDGPALFTPAPVTAPGQVSYADAGLSVSGFMTAVSAAVARIRAGEAAKVVLSHDMRVTTAAPVDERYLLLRLAADYPTCATFAVDGLVGASPEMLLRRTGNDVTSRVLAGTAWPEHSGDPVEQELLASGKDLEEHEYAVRSVASVLAPVTSELEIPAGPRPLTLANLTHLATDVHGRLTGSGAGVPSALDLAALLHPTAAVGGTPTEVALAMIADLEPVPRGRYAAPVGWMDAAGDGEFAIALRCAEVSGRSVRMMAGCGIVADSDPATEAREAQIKMVPIRDALGS
jgi:menaquinone-specific isochorismate synthase